MAWPSTLESFLLSMVAVVDIIMVSGLGTPAIAAVGLTTQPKFIGLAIFLSLNVAVSALVARRCGECDTKQANQVLGHAMLLTLLLTVVVSIVCVVFADPIVRFAGSEPDSHQLAVNYFKIIMGAMFFNVMSLVINAAQRGAGNTRIALRTNLVSNGVNLVLNYILIYGKFGLPALGVNGSAIATVLGTVCAFFMSIRSILVPHRLLSFKEAVTTKLQKSILFSIFNVSAGTLAEQLFLRIGFLTYAIIVAKLGTVAFAAHQIGMNIITISFSFGDGLSVAAVALIGKSLGECRPDNAKLYGAACQRFGVLCSVLLAPVFLFLGKPIFSLFSTDPVILQYGVSIMRFLTVILFLQISQVIYSGCLRGAGDTRYTAFVSFLSVALIRPGLGYLFCYPLGWGLVGAWLGLAVDQFMRFWMTALRFRKGRWMHIKI